MPTPDDDRYLTVEDAADILRLTTRQTNRYGTGDTPRIRTKHVGRRVLYLRQDVEALAEELNVTLRPAIPKAPRAELVPISEVFETMNAMQLRLEQAALDVGRLQGLLEAQRQQITDSEDVKQRLLDVQAENARLRQVEQLLADAQAERDQLQRRLAQMEAERTPPQPRSLWDRLRGK